MDHFILTRFITPLSAWIIIGVIAGITMEALTSRKDWLPAIIVGAYLSPVVLIMVIVYSAMRLYGLLRSKS